MVSTVDLAADLPKALRNFRLKSGRAGGGEGSATKVSAFIAKIDKAKLVLEEDEKVENVTLEELVDELPENTPRFVVLSYKLEHGDGRISYPLVLIYWAPSTSSMELLTLYASALSQFSAAADVARVIDVRDGELTKELIDSKLGGRK